MSLIVSDTGLAFGSGLQSQTGVGGAGLGVSAGGITVDLWQNFAFATLTVPNLAANDHATGGTWTIVDDDAQLSVDVGADKVSTGLINGEADASGRGFRYNQTLGVVGTPATIRYELPTPDATISFGFWFRFGPSFVGGFEGGNPDIIHLEPNVGDGTGYYVKLTDNNQARFQLFTPASGFSSNINAAPDTWYWLTGLFGTTHRLSVYSEAGALLGEVTRPGTADAVEEVRWGSLVGQERDTNEDPFEWDDLVLDWTNAVYPLGPPQG